MSTSLQQRQQQLMAYLLKGDKAIGEHIVDQGRISIDTRLNIYGNAYRTRLRETIETDHSLSGNYLGDELFDQMATGYIDECASKHRSLRHFGDDLADYVKTRAPFNEHPQISELVRFERLLLTAFDAADGERANIADLTRIEGNHWPSITLKFHPSVQLFSSHWNAVNIWQALKQEQTPPAPINNLNHWLLWRNTELLTEFRHCSSAEFCCYEFFAAGESFADACDALLNILPEEDVSSTAVEILVKWLNSGFIHAINSEPSYQL